VDLVATNPHLRPRVGNPDELRSNRMGRTLDRLKHRVNRPEPGSAEAVDGAVITALNEEAVSGAALGNKGGLNLIVSYEAFAMKMLGALRQEIVFARRQREAGAPAGWISIPLIATSHTWENSKNEQSHQDPTLGEALLGEMSDTARVLFPIDANSAVAALRGVYRTRGQIACLVTPKRVLPRLLDAAGAADLVVQGWAHLAGAPGDAQVQIVAVGAYQALEALKARDRLEAQGRRACVTAVLEPGRLRAPRDALEAECTLADAELEAAFPRDLPRVLVSHTRPEPMQGLLRRIDGGGDRLVSRGYIGRGGTFDVFGMLFANRCTWAHLVEAAARVLDVSPCDLLTEPELKAVAGRANPRALDVAAL
jgi:phosphoketolase